MGLAGHERPEFSDALIREFSTTAELQKRIYLDSSHLHNYLHLRQCWSVLFSRGTGAASSSHLSQLSCRHYTGLILIEAALPYRRVSREVRDDLPSIQLRNPHSIKEIFIGGRQ